MLQEELTSDLRHLAAELDELGENRKGCRSMKTKLFARAVADKTQGAGA